MKLLDLVKTVNGAVEPSTLHLAACVTGVTVGSAILPRKIGCPTEPFRGCPKSVRDQFSRRRVGFNAAFDSVAWDGAVVVATCFTVVRCIRSGRMGCLNESNLGCCTGLRKGASPKCVASLGAIIEVVVMHGAMLVSTCACVGNEMRSGRSCLDLGWPGLIKGFSGEVIENRGAVLKWCCTLLLTTLVVVHSGIKS